MGDLREQKGTFFALSYDATAFVFSDHSDLNSIDHDASLRAQWAGSKLTLGSHVNFRDLTGTSNELADRVNQKVYEAGVTATYAWSDLTTLGAELSGQISDYRNHVDTREARLRLWADHEISVLTKLGIGVTLGRVDVSGGRAQTYEQLLARVNYAAATKVDLMLQVGGELRQIEGGDSQATPVFSLAATYSPTVLLKLRLDGYRRVQPSIVDAGANTVTTGTSLNVTYRFHERFELSLGGAYEHADYESVEREGAHARTDNYFLARVGQSYAFTANTRLGAFYQFRTNDSTRKNRSFDNQQVGLELSVAF
jgi:hypothetical protein